MKQLPEAAHAIIERARNAHDPSEAQMQSMLAKLHTQLGYTEQPGASESVTAPAVDRARGLLHAKLLKLVLSLAAVGGIAALIAPRVWRPEPVRPSVAAVEVPGAPSGPTEGDVSTAQQADALAVTNRANDTSAPATSGHAGTAVAVERGVGSARAAVRDGARSAPARGEGSSRAKSSADTGPARGVAERRADGRARGASSADIGPARGVAERRADGSSRGTSSAESVLVGAERREAREGEGSSRVVASTDVSVAVAAEVGAPAPAPAARELVAATLMPSSMQPASAEDVVPPRGAAAPAEKVLLSDDVVPLQTARTRAQEQARAASDADELRLIDRAASLLRDGEPEDALELLQEHGRKFPGSQLKLERRGLSVLARCGAGQIEQGRRERDEFLRDAGKAPIAARVRRACPETSP